MRRPEQGVENNLCRCELFLDESEERHLDSRARTTAAAKKPDTKAEVGEFKAINDLNQQRKERKKERKAKVRNGFKGRAGPLWVWGCFYVED